MNKIVFRIGLLFFFLSIIFFTQRGLQVEDILLRSFLVFVSITFMLGLLALTFLKSVNKQSRKKNKELTQNLGKGS